MKLSQSLYCLLLLFAFFPAWGSQRESAPISQTEAEWYQNFARFRNDLSTMYQQIAARKSRILKKELHIPGLTNQENDHVYSIIASKLLDPYLESPSDIDHPRFVAFACMLNIINREMYLGRPSLIRPILSIKSIDQMVFQPFFPLIRENLLDIIFSTVTNLETIRELIGQANRVPHKDNELIAFLSLKGLQILDDRVPEEPFANLIISRRNETNPMMASRKDTIINEEDPQSPYTLKMFRSIQKKRSLPATKQLTLLPEFPIDEPEPTIPPAAEPLNKPVIEAPTIKQSVADPSKKYIDLLKNGSRTVYTYKWLAVIAAGTFYFAKIARCSLRLKRIHTTINNPKSWMNWNKELNFKAESFDQTKTVYALNSTIFRRYQTAHFLDFKEKQRHAFLKETAQELDALEYFIEQGTLATIWGMNRFFGVTEAAITQAKKKLEHLNFIRNLFIDWSVEQFVRKNGIV